MNRFIDKRKNDWQRLEDLLSMIEMATLRNLTREEVRELGQLYRRAASDLAIARAETRDPKLINYLNSLVIRAHGKIYRAESRGLGMIKQFFLKEFPQTFRRTWKFTAIAFGTFLLSAIFSFFATWQDIDFAEFVYLGEIRYEVESDHHWWEDLNQEGNQIGASAIMTNNIYVTFRAFAMGAFFGIGALYDMAFEGARMGSLMAVCYQLKPAFGDALATFIVGHGVLELSCIFLCGGAGMMIGYSILVPGDLSRVEAVKKSGLEAVRLVIGCAFVLVIAGTIEGFISPSSLPPVFKIGTGVLTGIALYSYLLLAGRERKLPEAAA
jgi:uncharacterized membrane protein SpoIIM required for sporulation